jgi:lipoic acid synthetase
MPVSTSTLDKPQSLLRKPPWLKMKIPGGESYQKIHTLRKQHNLATVCEEARCPNLGECWSKKHATFMLFGKKCTRACRFCDVDSGKPLPPDLDEPRKVAEATQALGVKYCVITSVNRDDLEDNGAFLFAETIRQLKLLNPGILVELLIPDLQGSEKDLQTILNANPDVLGHNLETSRRMHPSARPQSNYDTSLNVLRNAKKSAPHVLVKSAFMVGLGETDPEISEMLLDLKNHGVDIVHIGQYARPQSWNLPVLRYVSPEQFQEFEKQGNALGISAILAGPLVRSSYRAETTYRKLKPL